MFESNRQKKKNVSVILPAYNEEGNVKLVIEKSVAGLKENGYPGEVILINDGSRDRTREEAEEAILRYPNIVKIINHKKNGGLTEALLSGFKNSSGEIIVFLCADLQSDPREDLPKLINEIEKGYDVVLGWRQGRRGLRTVISKMYHMLSKLFFGISIHDMNWIKAFKKEVVEHINLRSDWHRYIPVLAKDLGYNITEIKTNYYPRHAGKTKYGTGRIIAGFLDLLTIKFELSFVKKPMLLFGTLGLIFILLGILLGTAMAIQLLLTGFQSGFWKGFYFLLILLVIVGFQFFSFGFIAEFLVTLNEKFKSIEERINSK